MQETSTRSPGSSVVTALPVSTTVPTASWPRIVPGRTSGTSPLRMWRSVPQIVEASILTIASVGSWIVGSGTSSQVRRPGPWYTSAFILRLLFFPSLVRRGARGIGGGAEKGCGFSVSQRRRLGLRDGRVVRQRRTAARTIRGRAGGQLRVVARGTAT